MVKRFSCMRLYFRYFKVNSIHEKVPDRRFPVDGRVCLHLNFTVFFTNIA